MGVPIKDMMTIKLLLLILVNALLFKVYLCVRIKRLELPQAIDKGKPVTVYCNYDLEGEQLYSVKFYKDYVEFYRYLPSDSPNSGQKFNLKGAYVDLSRSNSTHAFLTKTDLDSEGRYACEVSTEGPSFSTIRAERQMKVYVLPKENLRVEGAEQEYGVDETINVTCKSGESMPAPNVTWFINDNLASEDQLIRYPPQRTYDGLQSTKLGLIFVTKPNHFHRGILKLGCRATMTLVYEFETVQVINGGIVKPKSNGDNSYKKDWSLQPDHETPEIKGGKQRYHVNDILNLNCTILAHDAQLKWYIGSIEANPHQLIRYNMEDTEDRQILGLRFIMEQQYFQIQELKLRCVALFHHSIADFKEDIVIRTYNQLQEEPWAKSQDSGSNSLILENFSGLNNLLASIIIMSMQAAIYFGG